MRDVSNKVYQHQSLGIKKEPAPEGTSSFKYLFTVAYLATDSFSCFAVLIDARRTVYIPLSSALV
ncbi:MAG: hypothetical protein ACPGWM_06870, partial [Flavobacteriales bacterium]